ncbi:MAG TPA: hypothetical protein VMH48_00515 [Methylomirabilota bacterium]|nr:hypothetical protein [Methylomirabilota bacterium]
MNLKKEVLHRLILAKSILVLGQSPGLGQPNAHFVARQVLNGHDAADLTFSAIVDQQGNLPPKGKIPAMIECLGLIDTKADKHVGFFAALNDARNALKHTGNLPHTTQWANVGEDVFQRLSSLCEAALNISLEALDESEFVSNNEVKAHLTSAKQARERGEFKIALEELAKALFRALESTPGLEEIKTGRAKAEDALKLTGFGVSANDFLRLQEFLPMVSAVPAPDWRLEIIEGVLWKQSDFGHPANWREDVVDFCIRTCLSVAISVQNAPSLPSPREFSHLYDYKVTASKDQVEVWEDLVDEEDHMAQVYPNNARPFRVSRRTLRKGESVVVSPYVPHLVSDDLSLSGEPIKRVQLTHDPMFGIIGGLRGRAEFVDLADVTITCVPNELSKDYFPDLEEMPWMEDPPAYRL